MILPETDLVGAQTLAEQIRRQCHQVKSRTVRAYEIPHLSVGVSSCMPDDSLSAEDLFEQVDKASTLT